MRLGVIARADHRGLGNQSWEVIRHLDPERVLVVRVPGSEAQGFAPDLDRYPNATVVTVDESNWTLPQAEVRDWLSGLNVVYSPETLYDWRLAGWAKDAGCGTVVHANPEFFTHWKTGAPEPSQLWAPTDWRLEHLPPETLVVPMPAPTDRFPVKATGDSVLHIGGRSATGDRNGTDLVLEAARLTSRHITVASQSGVRRARGVTVVPHTEQWWDLYAGHGILLLPRRYGGLCLPILEACAAGMVPIATDVTPNRAWPIVPLPTHRGANIPLPAGTIQSYDTTPEAIVEALDNLDVDKARDNVNAWVEENSWEALAPRWLEALHEARSAKPRKAPSVSVVVPFSPGCPQREAVWAWLRQHYAKHHPKWQVVTAGHTGEWCKGEALKVIDDITSDIVVVADADCLMAPAELRSAVARASLGAPWVVPHLNVLRLDRQETQHLLQTSEVPNIQRRQRRRRYYVGVAGGGMVIFRRSAWDTAPMDKRFKGWGYEDVCWGAAMDTLVGPHVRLDAELLHLWHPPQPNREAPHAGSEALYQSYLRANGLPRRMAALIAGEEPDVTASHPVTFRSTARVLKLGPQRRIEFHDGTATVTDPDVIDALRRREDIEEVA